MKIKSISLCFVLLFSLLLFGACGESDGGTNSGVNGGNCGPDSYKAQIIEKISDYELIVEIIPWGSPGGQSQHHPNTKPPTERETEHSLITGDIVKAVFNERKIHENDKKRLDEAIVGDIAYIGLWLYENKSLDFSVSPIVINCDTIQLYDEYGEKLT